MKNICLCISLLILPSLGLAEDDPKASMHGYHTGLAEFPAWNYDSLWEAAVPLDDAPNGKALLDHCMATYGGEEHLRTLSSYKVEWIMTSLMGGDSVAVTRSVAPNRRHRIEIAKPGRPETRILNGLKAWHQSGNQAIALDGMRYKAELFTNLGLRLPLSMRDGGFAEARYLVQPGDSLEYVIFDYPDSLWFMVGIDPKRGTVHRTDGVIRHDESRMVFVNLLSDYETISGYLFPRRLINVAMGLKVGDSRLLNLVVNPEFPAGVFAAPLAAESVH